MNYEFEMANFLREQRLPANENTYPPELMTQITIAAFDELLETIETLEDALEESEDKLSDMMSVLDELEDVSNDIKDIFTRLK